MRVMFLQALQLHHIASYHKGDTNVSNANVIDLDSYEELLDRYGCMIKALEKEMAKIEKLENENSFLKNTCEQQKHLLYVTTCSHEELKLAHEELSVSGS